MYPQHHTPYSTIFKTLNGDLTVFNKTLISTKDNLKSLETVSASVYNKNGEHFTLKGLLVNPSQSVSTFTKLNNTFKTYNSNLSKSNQLQNSYVQAIGKQNTSLGNYLAGLNGAKASLGGYIKYLIGAKAATIGLQVASTALNIAISMGITLAINALISQVSKLSQAKEEARQKAVELTNAYKEQQSSLDSQIKKYKELKQTLDKGNLSTEETRSIKEQLLEIQNALIESYGNEVSNIDLVNGKYKEQLGLLNELSKEEATDYVIENRDAFAEAKTKLEEVHTYDLGAITNFGSYAPKTEDQQKLLDYIKSYSNLIKLREETASYGDDYSTTVSLSVEATAEEADTLIHQFAEDLEHYGKENNIDVSEFLTNNISPKIGKIWTDELKEHRKIYDEFMKAEIVRNDTLRPLYQQSIRAVEDYNKALSSGEGIPEAKANLEAVQQSVQNATGELEGSQEVFDGIYDGINKDAEATYNLSQAFENDDTVKEYAEQLSGLSDNDLKVIDFDNDNIELGEEAFKGLIDTLGLTEEEVQNLIDKLVELGYVQSTVTSSSDDTPTFNITTHSEAIDNFQSKVKSLGDTLSSLRSGNLTPDDLIDLQQEFPDLEGKTDNLEQAISNLINKELKKLYETLGENIPDDLKKFLEETTKAALGLSKSLHDAFSDIQDSWEILHNFKETMDSGFDDSVTDDLLQSVRGLSGELENLVAGYYSGIVTAEQLYEALTEHYETDLHNYSEAFVKKNELSEEFYKAVGLSDTEVINQFNDNYGVDIERCKTYAGAKLRIEEQTLKTISGMWSKYYDITTQSYTSAYKKYKTELSGLQRSVNLLPEGEQKDYVKQRIAELKEEMGLILETEKQAKAYEEALAALNSITYDGIEADFEFTSSKLSSNSSGSSSTAAFSESFDWIETAINRMERAVSKMGLAADSTYRTWTTRNKSLKNEISETRKEIDLQQKAYARYMKQANSVGLSASWAKKVREGSADLETVTDETLAGKIKEYQDWYEKAIACQDAIEDLNESVSKLYETAFNNVVSEYDSILSMIEHEQNMLEGYISQTEEKGYLVSAKYYEALLQSERKNISELEKERAALIASLNDAVNSNAIQEYSETWYGMVDQINEVTRSIQEGTTSLIEYANAIRDINWEVFNMLQDNISRITKESDFLINLLSSKDLYNERGQLTEEGQSTMGLHGANYNVYMAQADKYAKELLKIDKELAKDPYNQTLLKRRQELLGLQQDMIAAAEDEKQAIVDMVEEGIDLELNALQELISSYTEALDAQKDLYDYQKRIAGQTKEIASLQKQLSAYEGDLSEESRAKIQQIRVSLEEAKQNLEETEYERYISDQKQLLDDLYLEYETVLNQRLDNVDNLVSDMISGINGSADIISSTLQQAAADVGYTMTAEMQDIWGLAADRIGSDISSLKDVLTVYSSDFNTKATTTNETLNGIQTYLAAMVAEMNSEAAKAAAQAVNSSASKTPSSGGSSSSNSKTSSSSSSKGNASSATSGSGDGKPQVGDKVLYVSGIYYEDSYGGGKHGSYKRGDYVYITALNPSGTYPYHISSGKKLGSGDLGWVNLSQLNGYAAGKQNFAQNEIAWTQEGGKPEFILYPDGTMRYPDGTIERPDGAKLTPVPQGASVFSAAASDNLWNLANNPSDFIRQNLGLNGISVPTNTASNNYTQNLDKVVFHLPNVRNYEELLYEMQHDKNFERLIQSMSVDRIAGKSSLAKYGAIHR